MAKGAWKEPISTIMATVLVALALIIGFVGGIVFSDRAYRKMGMQSAMPKGQIPPGMDMSQLPEGHPPIDNSGQMQGQLPEGHPAITGEQTQMPSAELQKSIDMMKKMLEKNPKDIDLLVGLGNLYFDNGQHEQAIDTYEKVLKMKADMPEVWVDCGVMYREVKDYNKAIEYFKKALTYNSKFVQAYFNLGVVYKNDLNDIPKAIEAWTKFLELEPASERANSIRQEVASMQTQLKTGKKVMGANSSNILERGNESSHEDPVIARGMELYNQKGCISCHAMNGRGGKTGPDLTHVGSKRDAKYLEKILVAPKSITPSTTMPAVVASKQDIQALVKYLQSLK